MDGQTSCLHFFRDRPWWRWWQRQAGLPLLFECWIDIYLIWTAALFWKVLLKRFFNFPNLLYDSSIWMIRQLGAETQIGFFFSKVNKGIKFKTNELYQGAYNFTTFCFVLFLNKVIFKLRIFFINKILCVQEIIRIIMLVILI